MKRWKSIVRASAVLAAGVLVALGLLSSTSPTARADSSVESLVVDAVLGADGILAVTETYTFAGGAPAELTKRFATRENGMGDIQYVQQITDMAATVGGQPVTVTTNSDRDSTTISVPTQAATGPLVLTYKVRGAVRVDGDDHLFQYRVLQGLSLPVTQVTATVTAPDFARAVSCYAGPPNSTGSCLLAAQGTHDNLVPTWQDGPRGVGEQVTAIAPFAPETVAATAIVEYRWSLGRAFSVGPAELLTALGLLVVGGLLVWALHRRTGRDAAASGKMEQIAQFAPVGDGESEFRVFSEVRPGHVGTVADERVDPIDVTASIVDLAVRGHLLITELPREREFGMVDWVITRRDSDDELAPFEQRLVEAVSDDEGVRVSNLGGRVGAAVDEIQDALYDDVVERGWYDHRPDQTRNRWLKLALGAVVVSMLLTVALAAFTTFGLLGLAMVAIAIGLVFVAQEMPARTASGAALLAGLHYLSAELHNHATDEMPAGHELTELSEILPYAIVLGGAERWLDAMVAADDDDDPDSTDLDWYHGPDNWHLADLPDSLRNFVTTVSGTLFSR